MVIVKRVGVWSMAKIQAVIGLITGLIILIIFVPLGILSMGSSAEDGVGLIGFGIIAPLLYCLIGFGGGALFSWIYNLLARKMGGIEVELEDKKKKR